MKILSECSTLCVNGSKPIDLHQYTTVSKCSDLCDIHVHTLMVSGRGKAGYVCKMHRQIHIYRKIAPDVRLGGLALLTNKGPRYIYIYTYAGSCSPVHGCNCGRVSLHSSTSYNLFGRTVVGCDMCGTTRS